MKIHGQLIIFTRFPTPGKTKTRLIPHLGAEGAATVQRAMTEHTVRQARQSGAQVEIRYTGGSLEQMRNWLGTDLAYAEQGGGDLGERMERAFADSFSRGAERVALIGSDCPSNDWKNMRTAFQALEKNDCAIGPATDGGYYSIGLSKPAPQLFQGLEWGSDRVLEQTLAAASGLSVAQLKNLSDVDYPEDLPPRISVVVPTLNEKAHLFQTLEKVGTGFNVEAIVVDGGSTDGTRRIAPNCLGCGDGRAAQQNLGARKSSGEILLFLHADTQLPDGWDWIVRDTLADSSVALGAFSFRIKERMRGVEFIEGSTNWRSRVWKLPYGDQGLFMRRERFDAIGGSPLNRSWRIMPLSRLFAGSVKRSPFRKPPPLLPAAGGNGTERPRLP